MRKDLDETIVKADSNKGKIDSNFDQLIKEKKTRYIPQNFMNTEPVFAESNV